MLKREARMLESEKDKFISNSSKLRIRSGTGLIHPLEAFLRCKTFELTHLPPEGLG